MLKTQSEQQFVLSGPWDVTQPFLVQTLTFQRQVATSHLNYITKELHHGQRLLAYGDSQKQK